MEMQQYLSFFKFRLKKHLLLRRVSKNHSEKLCETHAIGTGKSVNLVDYYVTKTEE